MESRTTGGGNGPFSWQIHPAVGREAAQVTDRKQQAGARHRRVLHKPHGLPASQSSASSEAWSRKFSVTGRLPLFSAVQYRLSPDGDDRPEADRVDPDHVRAELSQGQPAVRGRDETGDLQDREAVKRRGLAHRGDISSCARSWIR
jgi:hypothetical protein